ncbi:MAG: type II secretion system F family protein [Armatimonadota bacterium]
MPNYSYVGIDKYGKRISGQMNADDSRSVLIRAKELGVFPTEVKISLEARSDNTNQPSKPRNIGAVRSSDLAIFSRQLANLVRGGLPLMRTFSALTEHTESASLRGVLEDMQQEVRGGKSLWEALNDHPRVFPPIYVSMVKAGEASGQLSSVLGWLADYLEKEQARKNQIRSALAYPTLLFVVGTITIACLIAFIVPRFVSVYEELGQALPLPTLMLLEFSRFVTRWWLMLLAVIGGVIIFTRTYVRTVSGRLKMDWIKLKIPLFGKLNIKSSISRFARTTSILLQGGVTLLDSMSIVRDIVGNEVLARGTDQVRDGMREGESFATRLKDAGVFPPLLTHMTAIGEETGDLQGVLITIADAYDIEVESTLKSLVSLLEPVIIVIIGGAIAFIILAMLLPVFQINITG